MNSKQHEIIKQYIADKAELQGMTNARIARAVGVALHAVTIIASPAAAKPARGLPDGVQGQIERRLKVRTELADRCKHSDLLHNTGIPPGTLEKILRKMRSGQEVVVTEDAGREVGGSGVNAWLMRPWVKIGEAA